MYKVGDRVKVKIYLNCGDTYGNIVFVADMKKYCGKTLIISYVEKAKNGTIYYGTEGNGWCWSEEMFEPIKDENEMNKMPEPETGMFVITDNYNIGVVAGNNVVYQDGGYDTIEGIIEYNKENKGYIKYIIDNVSCFDDVRQNIFVNNLSRLEYFGSYIWKYKEPRKVTMQEIYDKFGEIVEIVD